MPDLCPTLRIPRALEAHCSRRHSPWLRGFLMLSHKLFLWFCFKSLCHRTSSFLYSIALDTKTSLLLTPANPGFLRAESSSATFVNLCLFCNNGDTWTWMPSCPGFLLRQASWHHHKLCILSMII